MAPGRPDVESIDLLIDGDIISALGADAHPPDADIIDVSDRIIIPGLINAHLHTWQTALRGIGADWTLLEYLSKTHALLAPRYEPDDIYIGTLFGAISQIGGGTTTIGDWSHNNRTPEHATASLTALHDAKVRAAFLHGPAGYSAEVPHPISETDRLIAATESPLVTVGMAIAGPQISTAEIAVADLRAAAERGVVTSMHYSGGQPSPAWATVRDAGLLGELTNVVHGTGLSDEWIDTLAAAGVTFTTTPENELGHGHGAPIIAKLLARQSAPSLGTDTETAVPGDLLTAARVALAHVRGTHHESARNETGWPSPSTTATAKDALSWATIEGARALGFADRVGRLEPGMQADLVVIDARQLNLWPAHDPIAAALHADRSNIEAVMVAGTWRKRDHQLIDVDLDSLRTKLLASAERLKRRSEQ